jgi:hypothetical protein
MEKEKYDYAISLGYNCDIANSLISCGGRDASYPFDWNFTKMWKINELFKNRFSDFFIKEKLVEARYTGNPAKEKNNGITYVHDGRYEYLKNDDSFYNMQKEKYDRRIDRLLNLLNKDTQLLFIRLANEDTCEEHLEFIKIMSEYYPNCRYKLLILNMSKENIGGKIEYVNLHKLTRYFIGGYIREKYDIPLFENYKKDYFE